MKKSLKKKLIFVIFLLVLFTIDAILVITGNTEGFDTAVYNAVRSVNNVFLDKYYIFITSLCEIWAILAILFALHFKLPKRDAITLDGLTLAGVVVNKILKNIFCRERPNVLRLIKQGGYSFPSGHAMASMVVYGYLFYLVNKNVQNKTIRIALEILLGIYIVSLNISRIYLGVHYASDIFGGIVMGLIVIVGFKILEEVHGGEKGV